MSLASLNVKVVKGKQKNLPKLKTILANPYKSQCATLDISELQTINELLCEEISKSGLEPRAFATAEHVYIGLESVLRAINNSRCSCVFIALSIKPKHVVHLIARNTEVKNPTAPVYLVPELEMLTEQVFGISSLAFAFPEETDRLGYKLQEWIVARQKVKEKQQQPKYTATKRKITTKCQVLPLAEEKKEFITSDKLEGEPNKTKLPGDFISLSSGSQNVEMSNLSLESDKNELFGALSRMTEKVIAAKPLGCGEKNEPIKTKKVHPEKGSQQSHVEIDDFLQEYQSLEVHKIRPNPNKKTKKKRQKSKKPSL